MYLLRLYQYVLLGVQVCIQLSLELYHLVLSNLIVFLYELLQVGMLTYDLSRLVVAYMIQFRLLHNQTLILGLLLQTLPLVHEFLMHRQHPLRYLVIVYRVKLIQQLNLHHIHIYGLYNRFYELYHELLVDNRQQHLL